MEPGAVGIGSMANLTYEQKSCIEVYSCKMPEKMERPERGSAPEPGAEPKDMKRPEMTDEQKEAMDCMRKAMESCGVEMPQRPDKPEKM